MKNSVANLCPAHKARRNKLIQYISQAKVQLLSAYASHKTWRINRAKFRLARFLFELDDSSELGPTYPFKWGTTLELYYRQKLDPTLDWQMLEDNESDWNMLAYWLEQSTTHEKL